ncbi:MAG: radical SAM family heme chaperone HemW [Calditrichaeota bacterium]|nr:radical SAM family heme chaperone HemW [Calditrichota bacterium]
MMLANTIADKMVNVEHPVPVTPEGAGLYVHVPFCEQKCEYCDFYSLTQLDQIEAFTEALLTEMELRAPQFSGVQFSTVFFGGGTPSLLSPAQLTRIWQRMATLFDIHPNAECSIESNPGTLSFEKLQTFRDLGFNRLSMGVQSFNPDELKFLGRIHNVADVLENFANARKAGFRNINIDLMTAFPGISHDSFLRSLAQAKALAPEHIACYTLIFEPGTVFFKRMQRGELTPMAEEDEAGYYELAAEILGEAGYQQYEISNFARETALICRHNLAYWQHRPYLGMGPSAHSFYNNARFSNKRSLAVYLKNLSVRQLAEDFREELTHEQLKFEYIFLNLRLKEGMRFDRFAQQFGSDFRIEFAATIAKLQSEGLIETSDSHLRLSTKGWMLADEVAAYF